MAYVVGGFLRGAPQQFSQAPNLRMRVRKQARHLRLQGARTDNLAQRSVGRKRQQITRKVERPGAQGSLVSFLLHLLRFRRAALEIAEHRFGEVAVFAKNLVDSIDIKLAGVGVVVKIGNVVAAFLEVLIAGRSLLSIPSRLVDGDGCCQNGQPLDGKSDVRQIRDTPVAVLKIKGVQELLGLLIVNLG